MRVLVAGCIHGDWMSLYDAVVNENNRGNRIDLVVLNGDVQTFINEKDLYSSTKREKIFEEDKLRELHKRGREPSSKEHFGTFYKFYNGEFIFPCMVIIIGGNNENSYLLHQLPFGGFIAKNIFYLGRAGIIDYKGIRISGFSGIYHGDIYTNDYNDGFPVNSVSDARKMIGVRSFAPFQLYLYSIFEQNCRSKNPDILMEHDWPAGLPSKYSEDILKIKKPIVESDCINSFGYPFGRTLIDGIKPKTITAAHHHVYYFNRYMQLGKHKATFIATPKPKKHKFWFYKLNIREYIKGSDRITYAPEWIAILKSTIEYVKNPSLCEDYKCWIKEKNSIEEKVLSEFHSSNYNLEAVPFHENPCDSTNEFCSRFGVPNV